MVVLRPCPIRSSKRAIAPCAARTRGQFQLNYTTAPKSKDEITNSRDAVIRNAAGFFFMLQAFPRVSKFSISAHGRIANGSHYVRDATFAVRAGKRSSNQSQKRRAISPKRLNVEVGSTFSSACNPVIISSDREIACISSTKDAYCSCNKVELGSRLVINTNPVGGASSAVIRKSGRRRFSNNAQRQTSPVHQPLRFASCRSAAGHSRSAIT